MNLLSLLAVSAVLFAAERQVTREPDFKKALDEAIQILQGLIRVDTSNPPGNETKGAQYLKSILDKEGIPSEIISKEPNRGNLVARIKGNGKKKPILLMGHLDTVGVEEKSGRSILSPPRSRTDIFTAAVSSTTRAT